MAAPRTVPSNLIVFGSKLDIQNKQRFQLPAYPKDRPIPTQKEVYTKWIKADYQIEIDFDHIVLRGMYCGNAHTLLKAVCAELHRQTTEAATARLHQNMERKGGPVRDFSSLIVRYVQHHHKLSGLTKSDDTHNCETTHTFHACFLRELTKAEFDFYYSAYGIAFEDLDRPVYDLVDGNTRVRVFKEFYRYVDFPSIKVKRSKKRNFSLVDVDHAQWTSNARGNFVHIRQN